jgi:polyhydroxyalkanoate synthesis regulator phasin
VETTQKTSVPYIEKYIETDLVIQKHLEFSKGKVAELETKIKHTDDKLTTKVDTCAQRKRHLIDNLREKYDDAFKNLNEKVDNRHNNIISILNKKTEDRFTGKDGTQLTEDLVTIKEQLKEELGLVKDRLKRLEHYVYNLPHTDEDD